jgi:hypothetical protein
MDERAFFFDLPTWICVVRARSRAKTRNFRPHQTCANVSRDLARRDTVGLDAPLQTLLQIFYALFEFVLSRSVI